MESRLPDSTVSVPQPISAYSWYALSVLWAGIFFNYLDRQIFATLAEQIKADLHLNDAQLGMLYGTSFAVFYTIFTLVVGRLADVWIRTRLMAGGILLWSAATAMVGLSRTFGQLAAARGGVGIGEATANPCSQSLISDYFPPERRGLAVSIYLTGMSAGIGCSVFLGSVISAWWNSACQASGGCTLAGWQVTLVALGVAGVPVGLLVMTLREPDRGGNDRTMSRESITHSPLKIFVQDAASIVPGLNWLTLARLGGARPVVSNLALTGLLALVTLALVVLTGDYVQWLSVSAGAFAILSWSSIQKLVRPEFFRLTLGSRFYLYLVLGCSASSCLLGTTHFWAVPFAMRNFALPPAIGAAALGSALAVGAIVGTLIGGLASDLWQRIDRRAPLWLAMISVGGSALIIMAMLNAGSWAIYAFELFLFSAVAGLWAGPIGGVVLNHVPPRMRASAMSLYAQLEQCFWKRHFCSMTCTHRRECYHYIFGFG